MLQNIFVDCPTKLSGLKIQIIHLFLDCSTCYDDILAAATDCILSFDWRQCIEDVLGGGSPCIECVCEVIVDIGNIFDPHTGRLTIKDEGMYTLIVSAYKSGKYGKRGWIYVLKNQEITLNPCIECIHIYGCASNLL